eukprot:GFUD01080624.1.p1 GENE.GFUD01080624.1~~GFUD01080624.1.p1  ORF type:complete len:168 (+),score=35.77 GFUD01080624.1:192-695(+)
MATGGMGRQQINGDLGRDGAPEGGPGQVHQGPGQVQHVLSDDMLYKLSKKIAQLTKVIYSLNTKNDDLEFDMDALRGNYEEKLEKETELNIIWKIYQDRWEVLSTVTGWGLTSLATLMNQASLESLTSLETEKYHPRFPFCSVGTQYMSLCRIFGFSTEQTSSCLFE